MPSAIGVESRSARTDEYSVPQMNGRAPNWTATGSHVSVSQNCHPNCLMDSCDWRTSSTPIPTTMTISSTPKKPVPTRKIVSSTRPDLPDDFGFSAGDRSAIYCSLTRSSAFSSMSTTLAGSGE